MQDGQYLYINKNQPRSLKQRNLSPLHKLKGGEDGSYRMPTRDALRMSFKKVQSAKKQMILEDISANQQWM